MKTETPVRTKLFVFSTKKGNEKHYECHELGSSEWKWELLQLTLNYQADRYNINGSLKQYWSFLLQLDVPEMCRYDFSRTASHNDCLKQGELRFPEQDLDCWITIFHVRMEKA